MVRLIKKEKIKRLKILLVLSLMVVICLSACKKKEDNGTTRPGANEVWMQNLSFVPSTKIVNVGTTVKWINKDNVDHTVTSGEGFFDSGKIGPDGTFAFTFDSVGTRPYSCTIHPGMTGVIIVE